MTPLFNHPNDDKPSGNEMVAAAILMVIVILLAWLGSVIFSPLTAPFATQ